MIRRTLLALLALVLVAGASACGGDDGGDDAASDTGSESEEAGGEGEGDTADAAGPDISTEPGVEREFTGEGSEPFCTEVGALKESDASNPEAVDDATFATQMAEIEPPAEIAEEWTNLYTVQQEGADMDSMTQEEVEQWSLSGSVVATYLTDVCGLDDSAG